MPYVPAGAMGLRLGAAGLLLAHAPLVAPAGVAGRGGHVPARALRAERLHLAGAFTAATIAARRLSQCRGGGSGLGARGSGIGVGAFASRQLAWPRQSQALGAHRGESPPPRRHLSPQKVIGEHGVKATPYGPSESRPLLSTGSQPALLARRRTPCTRVRCCASQVAPAWGPLVAEGVLLGLLLLNLGLPCYYSGARDYLSRRIHQLECDGRGGGGRRAGRRGAEGGAEGGAGR